MEGKLCGAKEATSTHDPTGVVVEPVRDEVSLRRQLLYAGIQKNERALKETA